MRLDTNIYFCKYSRFRRTIT